MLSGRVWILPLDSLNNLWTGLDLTEWFEYTLEESEYLEYFSLTSEYFAWLWMLRIQSFWIWISATEDESESWPLLNTPFRIWITILWCLQLQSLNLRSNLVCSDWINAVYSCNLWISCRILSALTESPTHAVYSWNLWISGRILSALTESLSHAVYSCSL